MECTVQNTGQTPAKHKYGNIIQYIVLYFIDLVWVLVWDGENAFILMQKSFFTVIN